MDFGIFPSMQRLNNAAQTIDEPVEHRRRPKRPVLTLLGTRKATFSTTIFVPRLLRSLLTARRLSARGSLPSLLRLTQTRFFTVPLTSGRIWFILDFMSIPLDARKK